MKKKSEKKNERTKEARVGKFFYARYRRTWLSLSGNPSPPHSSPGQKTPCNCPPSLACRKRSVHLRPQFCLLGVPILLNIRHRLLLHRLPTGFKFRHLIFVQGDQFPLQTGGVGLETIEFLLTGFLELVDD